MFEKYEGKFLGNAGASIAGGAAGVFLQCYGFVPSELHPFPPHVNPFASGVKAELTISDVTFEKSETEDDDWVEFTLNAGDPAVSEFFVPKI